jgi:hypothetical protein
MQASRITNHHATLSKRNITHLILQRWAMGFNNAKKRGDRYVF